MSVSAMERIDVIVLGATGFTGKYVAKKLALINREIEYSNLTWGIAARSREKIKSLLTELENYGVNTSQIPVIDCDITDEATITEVSGRAKVLMNCTGPYSLYSEPVVKACIETRTHYVDISAELHHMLKIYRKYHKAAEEANVLIITACGFGSVPGVMGLMHLDKHFEGTLHSVECYTEIEIPKRAYIPGCNKCLVHYGTWASLVHELKNFRDYSNMKKDTFREPLYGPEPEVMKKSFFHREEGRFWIPYPGPDKDIIDMTQRYLHEKNGKEPVHFKIYTTMPLLIHMIFLVPAFFCYYWLSYFKCFRCLLWRYPRFFTLGYMSHQGPREEMMDDTKYKFVLTGRGWDKSEGENYEKSQPTKTKTLKIYGSDPGYKTTAVAFIFSAITILRDHSDMPKGGVVTTGVAFCKTQFVNRLNEHNIHFNFI